MNYTSLIVSVLLILFCLVAFLLPKMGKEMKLTHHGDPLFLTPLIKDGLLDHARNLSVVPPLKGSVISYAGFFTVNETYNSNMFFWFFPAEMNPENAPVVVWLQGGPGDTSLYGLFIEIGPFNANDDGSFSLRNYSWTKHFSVVFIDNPVGTGYSFTNSTDGYSKNEVDVGVNLYKTVFQFFQLFPNLLKNDFFVAGESYGGKYAPALAYQIHEQNPNSKIKINLKGIAIGNGFCDPLHMLNYGDYLYEIGLIDSQVKQIFDEKKDEAVLYINKNEYVKANYVLIDILHIFSNVTGFQSPSNFLKSNGIDVDNILTAVQSNEVRQRIHVGNLPFYSEESVVKHHLWEDLMVSVASWIETLLEHYKVLIYSGQLDIIVAYPLTEDFLKNLTWSGATQYETAERKIWRVSNEIAGYYKMAGNLIEVLVRNAGHLVPLDQPLFAFDMINRFVFSKSFSSHYGTN